MFWSAVRAGRSCHLFTALGRKSIFLVVLVLATASASTPASTHDFYHYEQEIDENQLAYTDVTISPDGKVEAWTRFSNGRKLDGDHFVAWVIFVDKNMGAILSFYQTASVEPSYGGSANEETVYNSALLKPEIAKEIDSIRVYYTREQKIEDASQTDLAVWAAIAALIGYAAGEIGESTNSSGSQNASTFSYIASTLLGGAVVVGPLIKGSFEESASRPQLLSDLPKLTPVAHPQCEGYPRTGLYADVTSSHDVICTFDCDYHSGVRTPRLESCRERPGPRL